MINTKTALTVASMILSARAEPLFADGGYQTQLVECMTSWTFKEKLGDGSNLETSLTGCVSIEDFQPFPFYDGSEDNNLVEPTDSRTDKAMWCPVLRDVYNPTPQRTESNKFNWGYCLDISTDAPTSSEITSTSSPTQTEVTEEPTEVESTENPTTTPPTGFPTKLITEAPTTTEATGSPTKTSPPSLTDTEEQENPSNNDNSSAALGDYTLLGIAIAGALFLVAGVLVVVMLIKTKKQKVLFIDEEFMDDDIEENGSDLARN